MTSSGAAPWPCSCLNRPEALNALSVEMLDDLGDHLAAIEGEPELRAVVITGPAARPSPPARTSATWPRPVRSRRGPTPSGATHVTNRIDSFPKPVIAAVNGYALGGGCELALACDIRLAAEEAMLGQPEVNLGIVPGWGGTQRLARATSPGFAKELIFTGRHVSAEEARAAGLVNHVYPRDELLDRAIEMGELIATKPPGAIAMAKEVVNLALEGDLHGHLAREMDAFALAFTTEDQREGMAAFFEKRPPKFVGR